MNIEQVNKKLIEQLEIYKKIAPVRDDLPDNADLNSRVKQKINHIIDIIKKNNNKEAIVKLSNGKEIKPGFFGGFFDYNFIAYKEDDIWKSFNLLTIEEIVITDVEKPKESFQLDEETLNRIVKAATPKKDIFEQLKLSNVSEQQGGDDGCTCSECVESRKKKKLPKKISIEIVVRDVLARYFEMNRVATILAKLNERIKV